MGGEPFNRLLSKLTRGAKETSMRNLVDDKYATKGLISWLMISQHESAWYEGVILRGVNLKKRPSDWILIIKVWKEDKPFCAFYKGATIGQCVMAWAWDTTYGTPKWVKDKWP